MWQLRQPGSSLHSSAIDLRIFNASSLFLGWYHHPYGRLNHVLLLFVTSDGSPVLLMITKILRALVENI